MVWFLDVLVVVLEHEGDQSYLCWGIPGIRKKTGNKQIRSLQNCRGGIEETAILVRRRWLAIVFRKWVGGTCSSSIIKWKNKSLSSLNTTLHLTPRGFGRVQGLLNREINFNF